MWIKKLAKTFGNEPIRLLMQAFVPISPISRLPGADFGEVCADS